MITKEKFMMYYNAYMDLDCKDPIAKQVASVMLSLHDYNEIAANYSKYYTLYIA